MDFHWGIAFFLFGKKVIPVKSRGDRTAVGSLIEIAVCELKIFFFFENPRLLLAQLNKLA